jgi:protein-S-isoprenylcysteine O-methyltransferase Ste14
MTPLAASNAIWDLWIASWVLASVWTRRTAARPSLIDQAIHLTPTLIGGALLLFGSTAWFEARFGVPVQAPLWPTPDLFGWAMTGLVTAGLGFTWWARVTLGSLWSGSVARKEGQAVVRSGPYGLVRHPIYTGIIAAAFALAVQIAMPANLIGAALLALGFWLKARLEERFLSEELGQDYADYRATTPMLTPFWPMKR